MAWNRKFLRVDLTNGTCKAEALNMEWAQEYLGQRGLATKYFVEEVDPKVDPLSADNKMIMATGPLTGTMASTGGRYSIITKGPLTGAIACSNSGGYFGAELKMAGWDMIIFEGKSAKPVYLSIENDKAELKDASHLWGKTTWDTEEIIKKTHQDPQVRVSSIGRAGENGVLYACVVNDLHRAAGRSGVGTVMGSKNLKAVAVRGTLGVSGIKDFKGFMAATVAAKKVLADNAVTRAKPCTKSGPPTAKPTSSPTTPVSAAPSPAGASRRWTRVTSASSIVPSTGALRADSNTRTPGRWAPPTASMTSMR